jgi:hypothetical protein
MRRVFNDGVAPSVSSSSAIVDVVVEDTIMETGRAGKGFSLDSSPGTERDSGATVKSFAARSPYCENRIELLVNAAAVVFTPELSVSSERADLVEKYKEV